MSYSHAPNYFAQLFHRLNCMLGLTLLPAESQTEIAYCYWREGGLDEARIMLTEALQKLSPQANTKARALLKLVIVECTAGRYNVALDILTNNASDFKRITNHIILGTYHNELAIGNLEDLSLTPSNYTRILA